MATPQEHYDRLLARHYSWMVGEPFEQKVAEQKTLLREAGVNRPGIAVDLGCGPGFQTIALADLGADHVHAVDTSAALLRELEGHAQSRPVTTYLADLLSFDRLIGSLADTIVCMGDTLTHLASRDDVALLFGRIAGSLHKDGRVVMSWRDLSHPPEGLDRFIPVRSTEDRLMLCFLEDCGEVVMVHDLIHERRGDGWNFERSAYPKLKLSSAWVRTALTEAGLKPVFEKTVRGMTVLAAAA